MVIPLTHVALILREKKNKRKMTMNNIKNTMCRLSDLTQEQIYSLVDAMPNSNYWRWSSCEGCIGFTPLGNAGTWKGITFPTIVTYTEMMQLLKGKDMNKQIAQEQIVAAYVEINRLQAIIDKPEAKTGRVMSVEDLEVGYEYFHVSRNTVRYVFSGDMMDRGLIDVGNAFHDKETAEKYLEYLKLEQELRRAQIADGGGGGQSVIAFRYGGVVSDDHIVSHHKISFNNRSARNKFRTAHTDEQLALLIRGV
jgi:hypothetical protein